MVISIKLTNPLISQYYTTPQLYPSNFKPIYTQNTYVYIKYLIIHVPVIDSPESLLYH